MSGYASVNSTFRITSGSVVIPEYGAWTADVALSESERVGRSATLTIGALTMRGTVYRSAAYAGSSRALIVGGGGGWMKPLPSRSYSYAGGVPLSMVLGDAAREVGETVSLAVDSSLGPSYVRPEMTHPASAGTLLRLLAGPLWWVDTDGITQVRTARPSVRITSAFDVIDRNPSTGLVIVGTEAFRDWMPGNTFAAPTINTPLTISLTTIDLAPSAQWRVRVLTRGAGQQ